LGSDTTPELDSSFTIFAHHESKMETPLWFWIAFNACVLVVLTVDLFGFQRRPHAPTIKEAATWTCIWIALSLGFNLLIWHWEGHAKGLEFLTGYLVEYSLSVDNIFVFVLVFSSFKVPTPYQHRVLFWGILSALVLRGAMIGVGVKSIHTFQWTLYVFGALLLGAGAKMLWHGRKSRDFTQGSLVRLVRRVLPIADRYHGPRFAVRLADGRVALTPLALALIIIEATDVLFAVDSIPAILGITTDPFIVYTSNVCAILGLRSLYFLLAGFVHKIVYLKPALAIILVFIGAKMLLGEVYRIPTILSLGVIVLVLLVAVVLSLLVNPSSNAMRLNAHQTEGASAIKSR
jgi:tellurite resistance protein TerC